MNNYLFILCGEAFSGKSTLSKALAEKYGANIIGRDTIYFALEESLALETTPDEEDAMLWENLWPLAIQGVKNQLMKGDSVVFDDNCFYKRQRDELRTIAKELNIEPVLIYCNVRIETLEKRKADNKISKHRHDVPSEWLTEDREKFERPTSEEQAIVYNEHTSVNEIIEQIDKTMS